MTISKVMMNHIPSHCNILYYFFFPFYWFLHNSLSLDHISNLNRYHFAPFDWHSLFILPCHILCPFHWHLLVGDYWYHFYPLYWYELSPLLFLVLSPLVSHIVHNSLWNNFLSFGRHVLSSPLFDIVSPLLWHILYNSLRNIVHFSLIPYFRMVFSDVFDCV